MPGLSVIVIAYKVEKYLKQCIESVLAQSYTDFELILVDDGSPDQCPAICDEYAEHDKRIRVIHQQNQGSMKARWNGILNANGEYISVLDGDDWIESDMYAQLMKSIEETDADIVISGYKEESGAGLTEKRNWLDSGLYDGERIKTIYENALYTGQFYVPGIIPAFWNKVIRRKLFFDQYEPGTAVIKMGDDAAVTYPMLGKAKTVMVINECTPYHYRVVEGSLSRSFDEKYFERAVALISGLKKNLISNEYMSTKLPYYALFIAKIGIEQLFSSQCDWTFKKRIAKLGEFSREYAKLEISTDIGWSGMDSYSEEMLRSFLEEKTYSVVFCFYKWKIKNKLAKR